MFKHLSLRDRFLVAPFIGILLTLILYAASYSVNQQHLNIFKQLNEANLPQIGEISRVSILLVKNHTKLVELLLSSFEHKDEERVYLQGKSVLEEFYVLEKELALSISTDKAIIVGQENISEEIKRNFADYRLAAVTAIELSTVDVQLAYAELLSASLNLEHLNVSLLTASNYFVHKLNNNALLINQSTKSQGYITFLTGVLLVFMLFSAIFFSKRLSSGIDRINQAMIRLARGEKEIELQEEQDAYLQQLATAVFVFRDTQEKNRIQQSRLNNTLHKLETALSELKEQKFALDQHAIVAVTNIKGEILFANSLFCKISGYSESELIGQNHRLLNSGEHDKAFWKEMYQTVANGGVWHNEIHNIAKDGSSYWVDTTIVPFIGDNGKPKNYIAIRTDITERKNTEMKLITARDLAEKAAKIKSQFLATVSHEIRTPMNGVLGMTELLLSTGLNAHQKHLTETAHRSAESLLQIINDILDFSKMESGKFELIASSFNLRELLEDVIGMLANQAHSKGLELILDLPIDLNGIVMGDSGRLRQVLINLLGNAIKFTQQGEVLLKVGQLNNSESNSHTHLLFEIIDTGPGIDSDHQADIFESFTQVDNSITRYHGGTGLGLSISKKLVNMMGGELSLNSTVGQGACFYFSLFFENSPQLISEKADISALYGINVLVVDDNATHREIVSRQLSHWGVNCFCVSSGTQALNHLLDAKKNGKSYRMALLDWHMPEMDGMSLAKAIHNEPLLQPLPLVMLSSDSIVFDHDQGSRYGINYFLNKPVTQKELLNCLLELMGLSSNSSQDQMAPASSQTPKCIGKILLAEDNPVNQEVGMGILYAIGGCQIDVVSNGIEAIAAAAEKDYDLILMDCHMPELDGFQATIQIRGRENSQDTKNRLPIIALTADVQKGIIEQCLAAGMDDYLSKPFTKKQMQDLLIKWLPFKHEGSAVTQTPSYDKLSVNALNSTVLDNLRELTTETGESLLAKVITLFLHSAPKEIDALQHALDQQDCITLTKVAHSFKSACGNVGAQTLADCAESLEAIAKQGHTMGIEALLNTMRSDLPDILVALRQALDAAPATATNEQPTQVRLI